MSLPRQHFRRRRPWLDCARARSDAMYAEIERTTHERRILHPRTGARRRSRALRDRLAVAVALRAARVPRHPVFTEGDDRRAGTTGAADHGGADAADRRGSLD